MTIFDFGNEGKGGVGEGERQGFWVGVGVGLGQGGGGKKKTIKCAGYYASLNIKMLNIAMHKINHAFDIPTIIRQVHAIWVVKTTIAQPPAQTEDDLRPMMRLFASHSTNNLFLLQN